MKNTEFAEETGHDIELSTGTPLVTNAELESEFIRPAYKFNELPLWPYTEGVDLVLRQINRIEDNGLTRALKFLFVLTKRGGVHMEDDLVKHIFPLAWGSADEIHLALFRWVAVNVKTDADRIAALNLYDKILATAARASVEVMPSRGKKKGTAPTKRSPRKSRS
jgi:hypothetical protein